MFLFLRKSRPFREPLWQKGQVRLNDYKTKLKKSDEICISLTRHPLRKHDFTAS